MKTHLIALAAVGLCVLTAPTGSWAQTPWQQAVASNLGKAGTEMPLGELARAFGKHPSELSRLKRSLRSRGLLPEAKRVAPAVARARPRSSAGRRP